MRTVLIGEDNAVNRELMTEMLEAANYRVLQAVDGKSVLAALAKYQPDVILLDLQMPIMDGRETIRRIREHSEWCRLPVIACTAFAMRGDQEQILELGFNAYLAKPVFREELLRTIERLT
jgi:CheY-like chemotaxis protein